MIKKRDDIRLLLIVLLAFFASWLAVSFLYKGSYRDEVLLGSSLSLVFNLSGLMIKKLAIGKDITHFFLYALILNSANLAVFFGISCLILKQAMFAAGPFIVSLFVTYFILLIYDIRKLRAVYAQ